MISRWLLASYHVEVFRLNQSEKTTELTESQKNQHQINISRALKSSDNRAIGRWTTLFCAKTVEPVMAVVANCVFRVAVMPMLCFLSASCSAGFFLPL